MQLHQILRYISNRCPIVLIDSANMTLCKVQTKDLIHVDYYEYEVMNISIAFVDFMRDKNYVKNTYLAIKINK